MSSITCQPQRLPSDTLSDAPKPGIEPEMTQEVDSVVANAEKEHIHFMREALAMAELALQTNETPVGCVFVHHGTIIGRGMNATNCTYNGTRHAEFMAFSAILSESEMGDDGGLRKKYSPEILKACDLYVTVEPCIMCASLLRQFGVRKVFYGASNEKFGGTGGVLNIHQGNGRASSNEDKKDRDGKEEEGDYEVSGGWLRDEAVLMLQKFYMQENDRAPVPKARGKKELVSAGIELGGGESG